MDFDLMFTSFPKLLKCNCNYIKTFKCFFNNRNVSWVIFCNSKNE